jgi:hypothetical protein
MVNERRIYLVWQAEDVQTYERVAQQATENNITIREYIQKILAETLSDTK